VLALEPAAVAQGPVVVVFVGAAVPLILVLVLQKQLLLLVS
jgi:hypothetical protein